MDPEKDEWGDNRLWKLMFDKQEEVEASRAFIVFMRTVRQLLRDDKRVKYYNKFTISGCGRADQN